jgi:hypothetical protein
VDWMCLADKLRTLNEVWSSVKKALRSVKETFLISLKSFSNFLKDLEELKGDFGAVVMLPLVKI